MKQISVLVIVVALLAATITGCRQGDGSSAASSQSSSSVESSQSSSSAVSQESSTASSEPESSVSQPESEASTAEDISVSTILSSIGEAYGENLLATAEMPEDYIAQAYPELDAALYEEVKGNMAMITTHPDEVIVVKAVAGKGEDVEKALIQARDRKAADTLQYPMNLAKTAAAKVVRNGDYVAYIMLGEPLDDETLDDAARQQHFEDEVQKGIDAFNTAFPA